MQPVALFISYGNISSEEVVENILTESNQPKTFSTSKHGDFDIGYYNYDIKTKYYSNNIHLVPFQGSCDDVPKEVLNKTEALIISFDSEDKSFLQNLPNIVKFYKSNNIELGFFITSFSDGLNEISFKELKEKSNFLFDIVILKDDVQEKTKPSPNNFVEIIEGLNNYVWSNVNFPTSDLQRFNSNNYEELENQLSDFENLLAAAQSLRDGKQLSRDEIYNKADELAEAMSAILNDDSD